MATRSLAQERIGEIATANNGMQMKIIAYKRNDNIDIQFEDGAVAKHRTYDRFKKGLIIHPAILTKKETRIGETAIATNRMQMKIIDYKKADDINVQFEDGTVVKHKKYWSFKKGRIAHTPVTENKPSRTGETAIAKNGMKMTIIAYNRVDNIDIQFEDGAIVKHKNYQSFKNGYIAHPTIPKNGLDRMAQTSIASNGMRMKIIAYNGSTNVDIQFEDGTIVNHKTYDNFIKGSISHPTISKNQNIHINETATSREGMQIKIIAYENNADIDIQFEDKTVIRHKIYEKFKKNKISHPLYKSESAIGCIQIQKTAYKTDTKHFFCKCNICGHEDIYDWKEIHKHNALHDIPAEHLTYQYIAEHRPDPISASKQQNLE